MTGLVQTRLTRRDFGALLERLANVCVLAILVGCAGQPTNRSQPRWTLRRELHIGSVNSPGYELTWAPSMKVDQDGDIYVDQPQEGLIRVYDGAGRYVRTIGRRGTGPGEFANPDPLGWRGDTLFVADLGNMRVTLFDPRGRVVGDFAISWPWTHSDLLPGYVSGLFDDGTFLVHGTASSTLIAERAVSTLPFGRVDRSGRVSNPLGRVWVGHAVLYVHPPGAVAGAGYYMPQPFAGPSRRVVVCCGSSRVAVVNAGPARTASGAAFRVVWIAPDGDTLTTRRYRYRPVPLSAHLRDSVVVALAHHVLRGGLPPSLVAAERWTRAALYVPAFLPPVTAVVAGSDSTLWLRGENTGAATVVWRVLDYRGDVARRVRAPADLKIMAARHDLVWGTSLDSLGVTYVDRYRIVRSPPESRVKEPQ